MKEQIWTANYKEMALFEQGPEDEWSARFPFSDRPVTGKSKEEAYKNLIQQHDKAIHESPEYKDRFIAWVMENARQISKEAYEKAWDKESKELIS